MQILGGFVALLGGIAVAVALILLSGATFGAVLGVGIASALVGVGLFATGKFGNCEPKNYNEEASERFYI